MNCLLSKIIITFNFLTVIGIILHVKGPTHKQVASECIEEIVREHFHSKHGKTAENFTMLFTLIVTNNMSSPGFEIQENVTRIVSELAKWYKIEILSYGHRHQFQTFLECPANVEINLENGDDSVCEKHFIPDFKSDFYLLVVDGEEHFNDMFDIIRVSNTFNPQALVLVYVETESLEYQEIAMNILYAMLNNLVINTAVLIPKGLQVLVLYTLNFKTRGPYPCNTNVTLSEEDYCIKGHMANLWKNYYSIRAERDYLNCTQGVIAMPYEPFVLSETSGFEIEVLMNIGKMLNVHFDIKVSENATDSLGVKTENGSWTGDLEIVYEDFYLGIGNIDHHMEYTTDFYFSKHYHMEPLVFVVPKAKFVPQWRVLIAIFTIEMWGICVAIIVGFGITFYLSSKIGAEVPDYRGFGRCIYSSFQMIICHAVSVQPVVQLTRVFFLSLAVLSIIIASLYTCSLVYYLKNPIREHQVKRMDERYDQLGIVRYGVGGVTRYRELFNGSDIPRTIETFNAYQTASGENNTMLHWIKKVADDRNIWTISSSLYANYLLSEGHNVTTDSENIPKVYVFKEQLMSYAISIIMRKGHPLAESIDFAIDQLIRGGIVEFLKNKYIHAIKKQEALEQTSAADDTYHSLSIDHLQGAFAILVVGYVLGVVSLVMEFIVKKVKERKKRNKILVKEEDESVKNKK